MTAEMKSKGALHGVRILDMATVLAAPVGATLCADHGAEVIKLELPDGSDALRGLQPVKNGNPLWWKVANRGKKGITLDVRKPLGRELFLELIPHFDVLIENFRTGTLDRWGLDMETLHARNPRLIVVRLTGFGQTGPYAQRPGYARIFEAMSGFTNLTGEKGGTPLHSNYPIGDYVAGLFCAFSVAMEIARLRGDPSMTGTEVDLSATEALFRLLDPLAVEYEQMNYVRGPEGNCASYTAPSNMYRTRDGGSLSLVASSNPIFARLCQAIGQPLLAQDPRFSTNPARVEHLGTLDQIISKWFSEHGTEEVVQALEAAQIPFSKTNSIEDILQDPHFKARGAVMRLPDPDYGSIPSPCIVPRVVGQVLDAPATGPATGQHNQDVYSRLGVSAERLAQLQALGVV
ncbi:CoA transferase [Diaphorobacter ruginosibacter]|uniref:CoA transferase n=1 Tax=Diaphorobacter ruginosibacter TaxID=1715720 RepID=A0A7G9RPK0_9BURK|nr:CoA transferase [Diaphorobacter ruginosibacter]